jgi:murein DD-endopeptidase MepM/ murein hydrolase activator NlpD
VQTVTDIPASKIIEHLQHGIQSANDPAVLYAQRFESLRDLFTQAGYGHLFTPGPLNQFGIRSVDADKPSYNHGEVVRIRFDAQLPSNVGLNHVHAYLMVGDTQIGVELTGWVRDQLYIDVPVQAIVQQINNWEAQHPEVVDRSQVQLKLVGWFNGFIPGTVTDLTNRTSAMLTEEIVVPLGGAQPTDLNENLNHGYNLDPWTTENLSILPASEGERSYVENVLLANLHNPVGLNDSTGNVWRNTMLSGYHPKYDNAPGASGRYSDFYAADLNWGGGDSDTHMNIFAQAEGWVTRTPDSNPDYNNTVKVEYTINVNINDDIISIPVTFTYLHMDKIYVGLNDIVIPNTPIGEMGTIGNSSSSHLHFEGVYEYNGIVYRLDLENWLASLAILPTNY